jgi:hypothetical protein
MSANGSFEITMEPQPDEDAPAGRMIINKQYSGGMVGTGIGQMVSKRTETGTAAYFAVEEFDGTLDGKTGSFTLLHSGFMSPDDRVLVVNIMEGSGAGELENISGSLDIIMEDGQHLYVLEYEFIE